MKRRVVWSPESRRDLVRIGRDIALDNPRAARTVIAELRAAGEALGDMAIGRPGRVSGTYERVMSKRPYIIAYELIPQGAGEAVAILHVIHTRRDWPDQEWPRDA